MLVISFILTKRIWPNHWCHNTSSFLLSEWFLQYKIGEIGIEEDSKIAVEYVQYRRAIDLEGKIIDFEK